jgi:hypothetical protein
VEGLVFESSAELEEERIIIGQLSIHLSGTFSSTGEGIAILDWFRVGPQRHADLPER